jgi:hypothetical protein
MNVFNARNIFECGQIHNFFKQEMSSFFFQTYDFNDFNILLVLGLGFTLAFKII